MVLSLICWGPPLALALEAALLLEGAEADEDIIGLEVARGGDEAAIMSLISQVIKVKGNNVPVAVEGDAALSHMDSATGGAAGVGSLLARQGGEGCGRC